MIAMLRALAFAAWFYTVTLLFSLVGIGVRIFVPQRALGFAQSWVRTVLAGLAPICGIHLVVTGREHLPREGAALIASQHQSEFDTLIWMILLRQPSYVMKKELTRIPLFGPLLVPAGMIPVDRAAGGAALRQLIADTESAIRAGRQIVIFPEGTRVPPGKRVKLQPGIAAIAARLDLPVIPVATDSGLFWTRGVLGRRSGVIHVAIGPAISAGTSRSVLLQSIETFWRRMEISGFRPVDKHVEQYSPLTPALSTQAVNTLGNHGF